MSWIARLANGNNCRGSKTIEQLSVDHVLGCICHCS